MLRVPGGTEAAAPSHVAAAPPAVDGGGDAAAAAAAVADAGPRAVAAAGLGAAACWVGAALSRGWELSAQAWSSTLSTETNTPEGC